MGSIKLGVGAEVLGLEHGSWDTVEAGVGDTIGRGSGILLEQGSWDTFWA